MTTTLRRELGVWQAVGLSLALMARSMAANINPAGHGRRRGPGQPGDLDEPARKGPASSSPRCS